MKIKAPYQAFLFTVFFVLGGVITAKAQKTPYADINEIPLNVKKYENVDGTPYVVDRFIKGSVIFANNKMAKDINLKFDEVANLLVFKNDKDQEFAFVSEVKEFKMPYTDNNIPYPGLFRNGFPSSKETTDKSFFEVLNDGKVKLLRHTSKKHLLEIEAIKRNKIIEKKDRYFVLKDGVLIQIEKGNKPVMDIMSDKSDLVKKYISENSLNLKNDPDLMDVFDYYNKL